MLLRSILVIAERARWLDALSDEDVMFLKRFVPDHILWAHFDTYAWRDLPKPGRPKGGEALGLRATYDPLKRRYLQA